MAEKPTELDFVAAAALPLAGAAAVAAVDAIAPEPGQAVLVNGASGGVGSYVVQLLAARGLTVFATGTDADIERLHGLGASTVIDHTAAPVTDQVLAAHPDGVDALINLAGYVTADVPLAAVRKGGTVASTTPAPDEDSAAAAGVTVTNVMAGPVREVIAPLADQAAAGTLQVGVSTVLPLDQAIEGLTILANGQSHGKIIVTID